MASEKEKWIDEVLSSTSDISKVRPSASLFENIEKDLFQENSKVLSFVWLRVAAVAAFFIIGFNIYGVYQYSASESPEETGREIGTYELAASYVIYGE